MKRVVISGCSGGGKSTLLDELAARGYRVFEEPGRAVVREERARGGNGLPWMDTARFTELCIARGLRQIEQATDERAAVAFFDRSVLDALCALETMRLPMPAAFGDALRNVRYHRRIFMTPSWPEIYRTDAERRHTFTEAVEEYRRLTRFYARRDYDIVVLPRVPPARRAEFVLTRLG